jgi:hypothetical protein
MAHWYYDLAAACSAYRHFRGLRFLREVLHEHSGKAGDHKIGDPCRRCKPRATSAKPVVGKACFAQGSYLPYREIW